MTSKSNTYIAFLRGINVGGHHKVPMADLKKELLKLKFKNVVTLLNSGNVIFESGPEKISNLEKKISSHLELTFGFPIPTIIRTDKTIFKLLDHNPFEGIILTKEKRFYVSLLRTDTITDLKLPWTSDDGSFTILKKIDKTIISVLDLSVSKTPKAMEVMEKYFGKDMTTRNWKTIKRIETNLDAGG